MCRSIKRLRAGTEVVPWQAIPDLAALGLTVRDVETAAYWVDDDGTLHRGEAAATAVLRRAGGVHRAEPERIVGRRVEDLAQRLPVAGVGPTHLAGLEPAQIFAVDG